MDARIIEARRLLIGAHLARAADAGDDDGLSWFRSGAPHEELNGVLLAQASTVSDGLAVLGGVPALWHSWSSDLGAAALEDELGLRAFSLVEEEPVMIAELHAVVLGPEPPDHEIVPASSAPQLAEWVAVWTGVDPDQRIVDALARFGTGPRPVVQHFLARDGERAVGCGALVHFGGGVALEHIVTAPGFRGRGIGTSMTNHAMKVARDGGAERAVLTASPEGEGIYRRLGFVEVDRVRRYRAPDRAGH